MARENLGLALPVAVVVLVSLLLGSVAGSSPVCLDEYGSHVDWWIILKMPYDTSSPDPLVASGYAYVYMDSKSRKFEESGNSLESGGALGHTLDQIYNGEVGEYAYLMYNDEYGGKKYVNNAHAKGVLAFDSYKGFWLVHSTPRFPDKMPAGYTFPDYEKTYGQSFICVTYPHKLFDDIGIQLTYDHPYAYDFSVPSKFQGSVPNIVLLTENKHIDYHQPQQTRVAEYYSSGGDAFVVFAKSDPANVELYEDLVAPYFDCDLVAETWIRSPALPSYCKPQYKYEVLNVNSLSACGIPYVETKDHSKWAVSREYSKNLVCVGDINRMESQSDRGGGTVCLKDSSVWKAFNSTIVGWDSC